MKVSTVHMQQLAALIEPLDTPERRARYLRGDFPRADFTKDLNRRYRWDLFYACGGYTSIEGAGYMDSHVETALRHIVPDVYAHGGVPWLLSAWNVE